MSCERKGAEVHTIDAAEPLSNAIARFSRSKIRCLVVTEAAKAVGVLTIRDTLLHLDHQGAEALSAPVHEGMTKNLVFVTPSTSLDDAHSALRRERDQPSPRSLTTIDWSAW